MSRLSTLTSLNKQILHTHSLTFSVILRDDCKVTFYGVIDPTIVFICIMLIMILW